MNIEHPRCNQVAIKRRDDGHGTSIYMFHICLCRKKNSQTSRLTVALAQALVPYRWGSSPLTRAGSASLDLVPGIRPLNPHAMGAAMMAIPGVVATAAEVTAAVGVASIGGVVNVAGERTAGERGRTSEEL